MKPKREKNRAFRNWIRSLPEERRMEELQRIVSGGVLKGTSAKLALHKLQERCYVKLQRLDMMRGMVACASADSCPPEVVPPSPADLPPSPSCSPPKLRRAVPASRRPCPLSRKRPSVLESSPEECGKRKRADSGVCSEADVAAEDSAIALSSPECQKVEDSDSPESSAVPSPVSRPQSVDSPAEEPSKEETQLPPSKEPSAVIPQPMETTPPSQQSSRPTVLHMAQPASSKPQETTPPPPAPQVAPQQRPEAQPRVKLSLRVVDEALKDIARSIYEVETELTNLDQKLFSYEKLPQSKKQHRLLSTLVETSTLISLKAGVVKSCLDRGVAQVLGRSFYPKLLKEITKISQLRYYSDLRLMTLLNILLGVLEPNSDPKYIVDSFIAHRLNEYRPEAFKALPPEARMEPQASQSNASQPKVSQPAPVSAVPPYNDRVPPAYPHTDRLQSMARQAAPPQQSYVTTVQQQQRQFLGVQEHQRQLNHAKQQQLQQQLQAAQHNLQQLQASQQQRQAAQHNQQLQAAQHNQQLQAAQHNQQLQAAQHNQQLQAAQHNQQLQAAQRNQQLQAAQHNQQLQASQHNQQQLQAVQHSQQQLQAAQQRQMQVVQRRQAVQEHQHMQQISAQSSVQVRHMQGAGQQLQQRNIAAVMPNTYATQRQNAFAGAMTQNAPVGQSSMYSNQTIVSGHPNSQYGVNQTVQIGYASQQQLISHQTTQQVQTQVIRTQQQSSLPAAGYTPVQYYQQVPVPQQVYITLPAVPTQESYRMVNQDSPATRTVSRDSGIATPEPQYEDPLRAMNPGQWKPM